MRNAFDLTSVDFAPGAAAALVLREELYVAEELSALDCLRAGFAVDFGGLTEFFTSFSVSIFRFFVVSSSWMMIYLVINAAPDCLQLTFRLLGTFNGRLSVCSSRSRLRRSFSSLIFFSCSMILVFSSSALRCIAS